MISRRDLVWLLAARVVGAADRAAKPMRGIFPIVQTPFTDAGKLDLEVLAREVKFLDRCGVHGIVWPQLASEYATLTVEERIAGAEAILAAGKSLKPAIVIGVQGADIGAATRYARHAEKNGADAIIALPPAGQDDLEAVLDYYRQIGKAAALPLFVQTIGNMSVEFVLRMAREAPTLRYVKDEAGSTLPRIGEFAAKSSELKIFTGAHGVTLLDEMRRGSAGSMPASGFADLYAAVWDLWQAGRRSEATGLFAKTLLLITEVQVYGIESLKYVLHLRGVFPNWVTRRAARSSPLVAARAPLDEPAKQALREALEFVRPHLRT